MDVHDRVDGEILWPHIFFACSTSLTTHITSFLHSARVAKIGHLIADCPGHSQRKFGARDITAKKPPVTRRKAATPFWQIQAPTCQLRHHPSLVEDLCGACEYICRAGKFSNLLHLMIHFERDEAAEEEEMAKEVFWIGLKGMPTNFKRQAVETVYESRANLADHKAHEDAFGEQNIQ